MKHVNKIFFLVLCLFIYSFASAQIFSYDFEQLNVGDPVAATIGDPWTTWNNAPGSAEDGSITDEQAVGNRSLKIDTGNDVVLKLGDKTTGAYRISFDMYVPEDKEAYFNVLHVFNGSNSKTLLNMWFNSEAYGNWISGIFSSNYQFDFPLNEWNRIIVDYYIDDALICVKINDGIVCLGKSYKVDSHMLSVIDFWPCSSVVDRNGFYIDNVSYEEIEGPFDSNITISPNAIEANLKQDTIDNTSYYCNLKNEGNTMAHVMSWIDYGIGEDGGEASALHYDSEPYYTYGNYNNNPYIELGVHFDKQEIIDQNVIGKKLTGVQYYVTSSFETGAQGPITIRVYKNNEFYCADSYALINNKELLAEKIVNNFNYGNWLNVELDEPIPLRGFGLFVTVGFQQANNGYPISLDAGPAVIWDGDFVQLNGGGWFSLNNNSANYSGVQYGNHNIRIVCEGQPVVAGWAVDSFNQYGELLYLEDDKDYSITLNTNGLEFGNYHAILHVEVTNDENLDLTIPLNLTVSVDNVVDIMSNEYHVYPNPTTGIVKIEAENIQNISIYNMLGKLMFESALSGNSFECDFSNNESGVYIVRIETVQGIVTKRITVM